MSLHLHRQADSLLLSPQRSPTVKTYQPLRVLCVKPTKLSQPENSVMGRVQNLALTPPSGHANRSALSGGRPGHTDTSLQKRHVHVRSTPSSIGDPPRELSAAPPRPLARLGEHSQQQGPQRGWSPSADPPPHPRRPTAAPIPPHTPQAPAACAFLCPLGWALSTLLQETRPPRVASPCRPLVSPLSINDPPWSLCSQALQDLQTRPSPRTTPHTTRPQLGTETASRNPGREARIA